MDALLEHPAPAWIVAHLDGCPKCRVDRNLMRPSGEEAERVASTLTLSLRSLRQQQPADVRIGRRIHATPDGLLVSWRGAEVRCLALPLEHLSDAGRTKLDALSDLRHPSLSCWRALREEGPGIVVLCDDVPAPSVHDALSRDPTAVVTFALHLARAMLALHQRGWAHGGLAEAPLGVSGTGRLVVGPPTLTRPGDRARDLTAMGQVLLRWASDAPVAGLDPLGRALADGTVSDPADLLAAVLDLADAHRSGALRYDLLRVIGEGGMGKVWRARDRVLDRIVALKQLKPGVGAPAQGLVEEAKLTATLQHPGVVPIHELGELIDGRPYYTMEEIRGDRLDEVIGEVHRASTPESWGTAASGWSLRRLIDAFARVCDAVAFAHDRGVVHRDLKPLNIKLGEFGEVRVLDWGLALPPGAEAPTRAGTLGYAAPEQLSGGPLGPRTDVFALGRVLEQILTGTPPGQPAAPAPPGPAELMDLAQRCTQSRPDDRPTNGAVVAEAVRDWLTGLARAERAEAALAAAAPLLRSADAAEAEAEQLRRQADGLLDGVATWAPVADKAAGWALEDRAADLEAKAAVLRTRYEQGLRAALDHDSSCRGALDALADLYHRRLVAAEAAHQRHEAARLTTLLEEHDGGRHRPWLRGDGAITLVTDPAGAEVVAERYAVRQRRLVSVPDRVVGHTPLRAASLPRGSWLLKIRHPDCDEVRYPVFLERGEHWDGVPPEGGDPAPIRLPPRWALGPDDVYVPAGWFWSGGDPEALDPLPRRRLWVDGLLVRRHPVTHREYLAFLNDRVAAGRGEEVERYVPGLRVVPDDPLEPVYEQRSDRSFQMKGPIPPRPVPTLEMPVTVVDAACAAAFATWESERDGKAWRLPHDQQWEKAMRGIDGRVFPWGDHFDATFCCCGPSHPAKPFVAEVSAFLADEGPYGVRGASGNVREWCANPYRRTGPKDNRVVAEAFGPEDTYQFLRGGAFSSAPVNTRLATRVVATPEERSSLFGIRLVADLPVGWGEAYGLRGAMTRRMDP